MSLMTVSILTDLEALNKIKVSSSKKFSIFFFTLFFDIYFIFLSIILELISTQNI